MNPSTSPAALLSLEGRVALVTGGSGGIGRAILEALSAAGATTINVDLPGGETPEGSEALPCDLS
ncbi:MAG: SDR family oxidoreductase, partial [Planctomycetota bacterium]